MPIPRSWKDLLDPKYKRLIAYDDPTVHGTAWEVTFVANLAMGGDTKNLRPGIDYLTLRTSTPTSSRTRVRPATIRRFAVRLLCGCTPTGAATR
jgi:ABC-type Fe3+ transport system substrate-binding protein